MPKTQNLFRLAILLVILLIAAHVVEEVNVASIEKAYLRASTLQAGFYYETPDAYKATCSEIDDLQKEAKESLERIAIINVFKIAMSFMLLSISAAIIFGLSNKPSPQVFKSTNS